jgi:hypothetical protein
MFWWMHVKKEWVATSRNKKNRDQCRIWMTLTFNPIVGILYSEWHHSHMTLRHHIRNGWVASLNIFNVLLLCWNKYGVTTWMWRWTLHLSHSHTYEGYNEYCSTQVGQMGSTLMILGHYEHKNNGLFDELIEEQWFPTGPNKLDLNTAHTKNNQDLVWDFTLPQLCIFPPPHTLSRRTNWDCGLGPWNIVFWLWQDNLTSLLP